MYAEERQQSISGLIGQRGRMSVADLAETFDVTTETVRRDLAVLDRIGLVRRVHGGAVPATTLTSLDFLGFGLPPGSASLGELLAQGKANLQAPWLGITAFTVLAVMLSLLIFIGEAVRDAFDPRKVTP